MSLQNVNAKYILAVLSASVGSGFQHGYNQGIINAAHLVIQEWIKENKKRRYKRNPTDREVMILWSLVVSVFSFGGIIGSSMTALFAKRFGHKGGLMWNNCIMFVAAFFICCATYVDRYEMFIFGRFLTGINAGLNSGLCPIYLSEIAPVALRGSTTALYSFVITISASVSHIVFLGEILGDKDLWPLFFGMGAIPAAIQLIVLWRCPEAPRFLLINLDDEEKTKKALMWFRNTQSAAEELKIMHEHKNLLIHLPDATLKSMFMDSIYRSPLLIALVMLVCQQCCGIVPALVYSTMLLEQSGLTSQAAHFATLTMGIFLVVSSFTSVVLIDIIGRRMLFLLSLCGLAIDCIFLIAVFSLPRDDYVLNDFMHMMTAIAMVLIGGWYGLGVATVPVVVTLELFHHLARPLAVSLVMPVSWCSSSLIHVTFWYLSKKIGYYMFAIYVILDILFFLFIHAYLPETKRKTSKDLIRPFYDIDIDYILQQTSSVY